MDIAPSSSFMATPIDVDRDSDATLSSDSDEEMKSVDGAHSPSNIHSSQHPRTNTVSAQPPRTASLSSTTPQAPTASFSASMAAARGNLLSAASMDNGARMSDVIESPRPGTASVSMANGKKRRLRSPPPPARRANEMGKPRASLDFRLPSNAKRVDQRVRLIDDDEDIDDEETKSDPGEKRAMVETTHTYRREDIALHRAPSSSSSCSSMMSSTMNRVESMRTWVCGQWFGKCVLEFHAVYVRIELLTLPSLGETVDCAFRGSIQNRQLERFCLSRGPAPYFAILEFARRAEFEPAFAEFYDAIFARVTEREGPSVEPDIYGAVLFFDDDLELARCQSLGDSTKTLRALLEKTIPADEVTRVRALKFDPSRDSSTTAPRSSTSILSKLTGSLKGTIDTISHLFSADRSPPKLRQTKIARMDATEASSDHESNAMSTQFRTSSRRKSLLQQSARDAEVVVQLSGGETDTAPNHASDNNGRSERRSTRGAAQLLQHQRQETRRLAAERKTKLLLSYPFEESSRMGQITITYGDIDRLKPGEFLNDSIIDFYLRYLWRHVEPWQQDLVYFFSSHFFTQLCGGKLSGSVSLSEDRLRRVARWTQKEDLFTKRFIFVPINDSCHWSIAVLCNPGSAIVQKRRRPSARKTGRSMDDSVILVDANDDPVIVDTTEDASDSEEEELLQKERLKNPPCLLFLDSLRCHQKKKICTLLKSYIEFEFNARFSATQASEAASTSESATVTSFDLEAMTIIEPEIPLQSNSSDCGVFLLMYTAQILQRFPAGLCHDDVRSQLTSSMSKQMFDDGHVQEFRDYLHQLIFMLSKIERRGGSEMAIKTEGLEFFAVEN